MFLSFLSVAHGHPYNLLLINLIIQYISLRKYSSSITPVSIWYPKSNNSHRLLYCVWHIFRIYEVKVKGEIEAKCEDKLLGINLVRYMLGGLLSDHELTF